MLRRLLNLEKKPEKFISMDPPRYPPEGSSHLLRRYEKKEASDLPHTDKCLQVIDKSLQNVTEEYVLGSPHLLKHLKNPSEEFLIKLVKKSALALRYIENPSEAVQLAAIDHIVLSIKLIQNPTEAVQRKVIEKDPSLIRYMANASNDIKREALTKFIALLGLPDNSYIEVINRYANDINNIGKPSHDMINDSKKGMLYGLAIGENVGSKYQTGWGNLTAMALALANFLQNNKGSKIGKDLLEAYKNSYKNYYPLWGRVRDFSVPMKMAFENKVTTHHCPESLTRIAPLVLMYGKGSGLKSTIQHEVTLTNSSIESLYMAEFLGNLLTKLIYGSPKCLDGRQASLPILISDLTITVPSHSNTYEVLMMVLSKCDFNTTMRDKFHLYKNDLFVFGRALIAVIESDSFESAIKKSIELSKAHFHYETNNERDTATICGQIAGAYYGYKKIPQSMIDTLGRKDIIQTVLEPML